MSGDPSQEQMAAREEVMKCEKEIQSIKAALRRLGSTGHADEPNSLEVVLIKPKDEYVTEFSVAIAGDNTNSSSAAAGESESSDATSEPVVPVCTVTLKVTYKPSPRDQREALYEILNKTSQRKASALENLRKISMTMSRESSLASPSTNKTSGTVAKPAVKPGFLNKKKTTEPTQMQKLYEKTIGPNSMLMKGLGIALVTRNYLIFFGAVAAFHYKGQLLSLPPPV